MAFARAFRQHRRPGTRAQGNGVSPPWPAGLHMSWRTSSPIPKAEGYINKAARDFGERIELASYPVPGANVRRRRAVRPPRRPPFGPVGHGQKLGRDVPSPRIGGGQGSKRGEDRSEAGRSGQAAGQGGDLRLSVRGAERSEAGRGSQAAGQGGTCAYPSGGWPRPWWARLARWGLGLMSRP